METCWQILWAWQIVSGDGGVDRHRSGGIRVRWKLVGRFCGAWQIVSGDGGLLADFVGVADWRYDNFIYCVGAYFYSE